MMNMKWKLMKPVAITLTLTAALTLGSVSAWAVDSDPNEATEVEVIESSGDQTGHRNGKGRREMFEGADLSTEEGREAFYAERKTGTRGKYASVRCPDVDELVSAGIIDQATADAIKTSASEKHQAIHNDFAEQPSDQSPQERHAWFEGKKSEGTRGNVIEKLVSDGVITQEQADAINAYLAAQEVSAE